MDIGVIGVGVVGGAVSEGLASIGHNITRIDPRLGTHARDALRTELAFICVPTPQAVDGSCDTSVVEKVVAELEEVGYCGLVVIKSTVIPGTTDKLRQRHPALQLAFCPEFLHAQFAYADFVKRHDVCVIGVYRDSDFELIKQAHGPLPKAFAKVTPRQAELCKYFNNVFNAARTLFADQFYRACLAIGEDYQAVRRAICQRGNVGNWYLDCREDLRGFGGHCLPKDTSAFARYVEGIDPSIELFRWIVAENKRVTGA